MRSPRGHHSLCAVVGVLVFAACATPAQAWILNMAGGSRALYLQVGQGTNNANNTTSNVVSVSVPGATNGNGTAVAMTSNSTFVNSFYDGYAVCSPPSQMYVGGYYRNTTGTGSPAVLSVTTPANLVSGPNRIPFSQISWTNNTAGGAVASVGLAASGTFNGATQNLVNVAANTWVENCLTFRYLNQVLRPAGVYSGRATYTLVTP
jgi:hypothetical protein